MLVVTTGACMMMVVAVSLALLLRATLAWHSISSPTPTVVVPCPPQLRHFYDTLNYASEWRENDSETHARREGERTGDSETAGRRVGAGRGRRISTGEEGIGERERPGWISGGNEQRRERQPNTLFLSGWWRQDLTRQDDRAQETCTKTTI